MKMQLTKEQNILMLLLKQALQERCDKNEVEAMTEKEWAVLIRMANKHAVLSILYDPLMEQTGISSVLQEEITKWSQRSVSQSYRLLYITNRIVHILEENKISVIVLKGAVTAALYPIPELRKSGDVDLYLTNITDMDIAIGLLEKGEYRRMENQHSNHHVVMRSPEGILIELHSTLAEPFDHPFINTYIQKLGAKIEEHKERIIVFGCDLPTMEDAYHGFYLLLHMLQHFLRAGFGLKLLCDWVVFWNQGVNDEQKKTFINLLNDCGLYGFCSQITWLCVTYLGLEENKVSFLLNKSVSEEDLGALLSEIFEAEEFGKSSRDRMVAMRGNSFLDYIREFHHQMRLNYPKQSENKWLWPVLWVCSLYVFMRNNRRIRGVSWMDILKKANKRSKIIKKMELFCKKYHDNE